MLTTLRSAALLFILAACTAVSAQTLHNPAGAYDDLPVAPLPDDDAQSEPLTIVPPGHPPATSPTEGPLTPMQPWTPEAVAYPSAHTPMSHAIAAEPWDGGWFGAVELMILRPYYFDGVATINRRHTEVGPRFVIGWEGDRGLGLRGRFADLNSTSEAISGLGVTDRLDLNTFRFDFDVYREFAFKWSSITVGGSITAAELEANAPSPGPAEERGAGVGFFVEGRHTFSAAEASEWSVLTRGRWAGLVGEWEHNDGLGLTTGDTTMEILEAGLGWEYKCDFDGYSFVFQHLIEVQAWDAKYINSDPGFFGQNVSLGFVF